MKTTLLNNETDQEIEVNIPCDILAGEIYGRAQYLRDNFKESDLIGPGEETAGTDCRLRYHGSSWYLLTGDSSYDQDHRGFWASSFIHYTCSPEEAMEIAKDLIANLE